MAHRFTAQQVQRMCSALPSLVRLLQTRTVRSQVACVCDDLQATAASRVYGDVSSSHDAVVRKTHKSYALPAETGETRLRGMVTGSRLERCKITPEGSWSWYSYSYRLEESRDSDVSVSAPFIRSPVQQRDAPAHRRAHRQGDLSIDSPPYRHEDSANVGDQNGRCRESVLEPAGDVFHMEPVSGRRQVCVCSAALGCAGLLSFTEWNHALWVLH